MASPDFCTCSDTQDLADEMASWRQALHRQPELAFEEHQTAAFVASKLREWGYDVSEEVGGTGVVGSLQSGSGSRRIGIRADMDALPIHEATGLSYASVAPGKMHACGHDGHTAMLLGAAKQLARTRRFSGTVHLIFQPAEERGANGGAKAMLDDGLFDRFPCDAVFGMHNHPGLREGAFLFRDGAFMAASDTVRIRVKGFGGHAARPHMTTDAVMVASAIVMALQTVVSRSIDPTEPAVVTVVGRIVVMAWAAHEHISPAAPSNSRTGLSIESLNRGTYAARAAIHVLADEMALLTLGLENTPAFKANLRLIRYSRNSPDRHRNALPYKAIAEACEDVDQRGPVSPTPGVKNRFVFAACAKFNC